MKQRKGSKNYPLLGLVRAGGGLVLKLVIYTGWTVLMGIIMVPYLAIKLFVPKRKNGSQPISKFFRQAFEGKGIKKVVGVSLAGLMVLFGTISNIWAVQWQEQTSEMLLSPPEETVLTVTTLNKPLGGKLGQGFHGFHRGVDVLTEVGTVIKPVADGVVIEVRFGRWGYGNTVVIEHADGLSSRYAHLKDIWVSGGNSVDKQTKIGTVGMTGRTTGSHLHLEIYENDRAIDPLAVLPEFSASWQIAKAK